MADNSDKVFHRSPFVPFDPKVDLYMCNLRPYAVPWEYTGWRDEVMSWKQTCYIHGNLNPSPTVVVRGPDALKFITDSIVNTTSNFPAGKAKHAVMCNENGHVMIDGVLLRTGEDEFVSNWLAPYMTYLFQKGNYNAEFEDLTGRVFLFQLAGPNILKTLEAATGDNLRDIKFMHHRMSSIAGKNVRVLRMGMGGTLAYEVHGQIEDAHAVYEAIYSAGEAFGIRKLGGRGYLMNHTENGYPQAYYHFPYPWEEDQGFAEFLQNLRGKDANKKSGSQWAPKKLLGSMGTDMQARYRNPYELGWGSYVKFDHDFIGREALEKIASSPHRKMVSLEWNAEDIADVQASQFQPGEHYAPMDEPNHYLIKNGSSALFADKVVVDGNTVGISSGRAYSYYYRTMISLCSIDPEFSEIGTQVTLLWGDPGTRQKEIRATVARFPYFNENRNKDIDLTK